MKSGIKFNFDSSNFEKNLKKEMNKAVKNEANSRQYDVTCPQCSKTTSVPVGKSLCPNCSQEIDLDLKFKF